MLLRNIYSMEGPVYTPEEDKFADYVVNMVDDYRQEKEKILDDDDVRKWQKRFRRNNLPPDIPCTEDKKKDMKRLVECLHAHQLDPVLGAGAFFPWLPYICVPAWKKNVGSVTYTGSVFMCLRTSKPKRGQSWYILYASCDQHDPNLLGSL